MKLVHTTLHAITLTGVIALSGCFDGDGSSDNGASTGQLTPTGIKGVGYQTNSQSGTTDAEGRFRYYPGESLTLSVGDLVLFSEVPAQDFVIPLEFVPDVRNQLDQASLTDEGLLSHKPTEDQLMENDAVMNATRFLLSLNWQGSTNDGSGVDLRGRVVNQLNAALPTLTAPVDFSVSQTRFSGEGDVLSPANQLLESICFYPADDELCEEPPTLEEIANAPEAPDDPQDREPGVEYKQDLENKRERILSAVRTIDEVTRDDARQYLRRELDIISNNRANRYYLDSSTARHPASDDGIKSIQVRKVGGESSLAQIEAKSTNPMNVVIHSFSRETAEVEYFIDGEAGREGEVLVNFRPAGDYRWVKKQIRVIIE